MQELNQFKTDLDTLKTQRSHVQIKLEESVSRAQTLKETLTKFGYPSLADAKVAYTQLVADAESKHERVKQLINQIKKTESEIPSKEDILAKLREESLLKNVQVPPQPTVELNPKDININL